ncbi:MAG: hypothetical protein OXN17_02760 [Candidatus Poribacteria bacterium]|nr:hypothetical protein [Candidatus Poribacteria bacterium]MDE0506351.1 hypothetical protein [Candidatus Poribacteria bacterium]
MSDIGDVLNKLQQIDCRDINSELIDEIQLIVQEVGETHKLESGGAVDRTGSHEQLDQTWDELDRTIEKLSTNSTPEECRPLIHRATELTNRLYDRFYHPNGMPKKLR